MTERRTGIANVAPEDLMTDAGSATTMAELASALQEHDLFWPPSSLVSPDRTLGEMLSHAPGGHTRLGAVIRRYVLALDVRLADGRTLRAGARTVKCVTGYDLKQLFIGSRGCLGTIVAATLRLESEANRAAVELRMERDYAGIEAAVAGVGPAGDDWRDVLARLKAELDPEGALPSVDSLWPPTGSANGGASNTGEA